MSQYEKVSIHFIIVCLLQLIVFLVLLRSNEHYVALQDSVPVMSLLALAPYAFQNDSKSKAKFLSLSSSQPGNIFQFVLIALFLVMTGLAGIITESGIIFFIFIAASFFGVYRVRDYLKNKEKKQVIHDERDRIILLKSFRMTFIIFWLAFVFYTTRITMNLGPEGMVPVYYIRYSMLGGMWLMLFTYSVSILYYYRTGVSYEES